MSLEADLERHVRRLAFPRSPFTDARGHSAARAYIAQELGQVETLRRVGPDGPAYNLRLRLGPDQGDLTRLCHVLPGDRAGRDKIAQSSPSILSPVLLSFLRSGRSGANQSVGAWRELAQA